MGLAGDDLRAAIASLPPAEFQAFPETIAALAVFNIVSTQWRTRTIPMGMGAGSSLSGLDYTACDVILRARAITVPPEVWADLQTIEQAILENVNAGR